MSYNSSACRVKAISKKVSIFFCFSGSVCPSAGCRAENTAHHRAICGAWQTDPSPREQARLNMF